MFWTQTFSSQEYSSPALLIRFLKRGVMVKLVIHDDPSDDKFVEAAVAGKASHIISGDKHLLKLSAYQGIQILKPIDFVQRYLKGKGKK